MDFEALGWNEFLKGHFQQYSRQGYSVGRVSAEHKNIYQVISEFGELLAGISGRMRHDTRGCQDFPAVGDWVVISIHPDRKNATIHGILPRQSKFSRKTAGGKMEEQVIAANINTVFLVNALNNDFNPRRIERYLLLAWESGASPVIVLSKADICSSVEQKLAETEAVAPGVNIHTVSSVSGEGLDNLNKYIYKGRTVALLGSSGAGKSTLVNRFLGEDLQKVREIRQGDDRGRHTTTYRKLITLPKGGMLIDTPGMRELQLWGTEEGLNDTFGDIDHCSSQCQFSDCRHMSEPNCAVRKALSEGKLDHTRYESYRKLQKELAYLARQENKQEYLAEKARWKKITRQLRDYKPR